MYHSPKFSILLYGETLETFQQKLREIQGYLLSAPPVDMALKVLGNAGREKTEKRKKNYRAKSREQKVKLVLLVGNKI